MAKKHKIILMSDIHYRCADYFGRTQEETAELLCEDLAKEYAKYNITANAICPAAVATDMLNDMVPEVLAERLKQFLRNRAAKPEEIASVITFLAGDDSSFVNGEKIIVTDGRMCN